MPIQRVSSRPCFYIRHSDGYPIEYGEGVPHFPTASHAEAFMHDVLARDFDGDQLRAVPEGAPCWAFECDSCGAGADELTDGYGAHNPTRRDAEQTVRDYEGQIIGRAVRCAECVAAAAAEEVA